MPADMTAIAAVADNGVIGRDGDLPWSLVEGDLPRFKEETTGHPVIMGRVTYEFIVERLGGPLSDRQSIVVSRSSYFKEENVRTVRSPGSAISLAFRIDDEAYVIGGESIYRALLPFCTRMLLTEVPGEYEGDAYFPEWSDGYWEEVSREELSEGVELAEYEKAD